MSDTVTLTLAHPLSAKQAERVLAKDVKAYRVGDKIVVRKDYALSIIKAGYAAGVDPEDSDAVTAALGGTTEAEAPNIVDSQPKAAKK